MLMDDLSGAPVSPPWGTGQAKSVAAQRFALLAKILVSGALLVFLSRKIDWPGESLRLAGAALKPLLAALGLLVIAVVLAALRWRMLVQRGGSRMPVTTAAQLTFAGMFFGQVLPATVGGDVVRGALACRIGLPWRDVVSGIVLDRITALLASVILILAGLPRLYTLAVGDAVPLVWTALASLGLVGVVGLALCGDLLPLPRVLTRWIWVAAALDLTKQVRSGLSSAAGLAALAISIVIHLSTVAVVILIGAGLGVPVSLLAAFVVVPLAILAAAVPISLNGWGIREGIMVAGFALFGISSGDALLISILLGFGVILSVLPGSLTWLALR